MNTTEYLDNICTSAQYISNMIGKVTPKVAIILGSGLGPLADEVADPVVMPYTTIPNFPVSTVPGHDGKLIFGTVSNCPVLVMKGRFHYYEGYDMDTVTFPVRVFAKLGIKTLIVTNAAGGINDALNPGSIMSINDQLSCFCPSPLRGPNLDEFGPRFKDMTEVFTRSIIQTVHNCADRLGITVTDGTYCFYQGPQFETPADIRALKILGADATGMSTVPETIVARHSGMDVCGLSLITNKAAGLSGNQLNHQEVLEAGQKSSADITSLVKEIIKDL